MRRAKFKPSRSLRSTSTAKPLSSKRYESAIDKSLVGLYEAKDLSAFNTRIQKVKSAFDAFRKKFPSEMSNAAHRNITMILSTTGQDAILYGLPQARSHMTKDFRYFKTWTLPKQIKWSKHLDDSLARFKKTHRVIKYQVVDKDGKIKDMERYVPKAGRHPPRQRTTRERERTRHGMSADDRRTLRDIGR